MLFESRKSKHERRVIASVTEDIMYTICMKVPINAFFIGLDRLDMKQKVSYANWASAVTYARLKEYKKHHARIQT